MTKWTVYCHIHRESGRRYVGLTKMSMMKRWNRHVYSANRGASGTSHFLNAVRKYGKDAFDHEVLEVCGTLEEANAAEVRWIEVLGTRDPGKGFNVAKGGSHQPHPIKNPWDRPEYREKATAASRKVWSDPTVRRKASLVQRGKVLSPEHRGKISANMSRIQLSKGQDELSEQSHDMHVGRRRRRESMTEGELRAASERHSAASKRANKISATRTPAALAAHRESCRRRSKYAFVDVQAVLSMLERGMTKADVARQLGIDRGTLRRALDRADSA